jgi:hypothetical protein
MEDAWDIGVRDDGSGIIAHRSAPRFSARWSSGFEDLADLDGLVWTDEGHGADDALVLHDFHFESAPPDQATFETLMQAAVAALDDWIAERL